MNEIKNPYIVEILKKRGFATAEAVKNFLNFSEKDLRRVADLCGGEALLSELEQAVRQAQNVTVYGDYDADGVMAVYILFAGLDRLIPGHVRCYVNNRFEDGYTITPESMQKMLSACPDTQVVLTCDNGISAGEAVAYAAARGVRVLVTDHHGQAVPLPEGCVAVDEKSLAQRAADEAAGTAPELFCGAELARRVITELYGRLGLAEREAAFLEELYGFAGFATVTDAVPMTAANHYVARRGLDLIRAGRGVWGFLHDRCGVRRETITDDAIGYRYGPMINASSRVTGSAKSALLVFVQYYRGRTDRCAAAVDHLLELNELRRQMCREDDALAFRLAAARGAEREPFILLADPGFREGINGLTASHLTERYGVPAAVLSPVAGDPAQYKGSARSVEGFDLFAALTAHRDFVQSGGHPMAAGLSLAGTDIERLRELLKEEALRTLGLPEAGRQTAAEKPADFFFAPEALSVKTVEELTEAVHALMPFGPGFEAPRIALRMEAPHFVALHGRDGSERHAKFVTAQHSADRKEVEAVWWNRAEEARAFAQTAGSATFYGQLEFNSYGEGRIQMIVNEARFD